MPQASALLIADCVPRPMAGRGSVHHFHRRNRRRCAQEGTSSVLWGRDGGSSTVVGLTGLRSVFLGARCDDDSLGDHAEGDVAPYRGPIPDLSRRTQHGGQGNLRHGGRHRRHEQARLYRPLPPVRKLDSHATHTAHTRHTADRRHRGGGGHTDAQDDLPGSSLWASPTSRRAPAYWKS